MAQMVDPASAIFIGIIHPIPNEPVTFVVMYHNKRWKFPAHDRPLHDSRYIRRDF